MSNLAEKKCEPCRGGVPPIALDERRRLLTEIPGWSIVDEHHLSREFSFPDFKSALEWVNTIGAIAEQEGHHPDVLLRWGKVKVDIWTHKIDNLTESDFVMAAKISAAFPTK